MMGPLEHGIFFGCAIYVFLLIAMALRRWGRKPERCANYAPFHPDHPNSTCMNCDQLHLTKP